MDEDFKYALRALMLKAVFVGLMFLTLVGVVYFSQPPANPVSSYIQTIDRLRAEGADLSVLEEVVPPEALAGDYRGCWAKARRDFATLNPECLACGSRVDLNIHHIQSAHEFPDLQCDPRNFCPLCRTHHKDFGHPESWSKNNPNVIRDSRAERRRRGLPPIDFRYP